MGEKGAICQKPLNKGHALYKRGNVAAMHPKQYKSFKVVPHILLYHTEPLDTEQQHIDLYHAELYHTYIQSTDLYRNFIFYKQAQPCFIDHHTPL